MVGDPPADTMYRSYIDQALGYFDRDHVGVPEGPVDDPAAWRSVNLDPTDWTVDLDDDQKAWFAMTGAAVAADDRPLAELDRDRIDQGPMATLVDRCRADLDHGRGFVLLRCMPVDSMTTPEVEASFWALGLLLGHPGAQNGDGDGFEHVPVRPVCFDGPAPRHLLRLWLAL